MRRQIVSVAAILMLVTAWSLGATAITIENPSFELPGSGKQTNFTNVPGWHTDTVAGDSGVETGYTPTDGTYTAYLRGQPDDPSLWQLTDHVIMLGDVFELKVDCRLTWQATTLRMTLYYDKDGTRMVGATQDYTITGTMAEYTLTFDSSTVPASAGRKIGVEFANTSGASTWLGLDRVRLTLTKEGVNGMATFPFPADGATDVARDVVLSWTPGIFAKTHNVYFGTNAADVNAAQPGNSLAVGANQEPNTFDPGRLEYGQTYYWRVDEVNAPSSPGTYKGKVWAFTVEPLAYQVTDVTATASSAAATNPVGNMVNGSGLDANDTHSGLGADMWLTAKGAGLPAWAQFDLGRVYKLHEMWVWNYNGQFEEILGFGLKDVTIQYSADGMTWTALGQFQFAQGTGYDGYAHNIVVPFAGLAIRFVRIDVISGWGVKGQWGLSEVQFYQIPVTASIPAPTSGATDVAVDQTLSWKAGREAALHQVYLGTDPNALTLAGSPTSNSFSPTNLSLGTKYYWRVDEVNTAEALSTWTGEVWSFTTSAFIAVEDMESYNDTTKKIFETWIDGYNSTTNGSIVGLNDAGTTGTFGSTTIFYGGKQSMPLSYGNSGIANSETTCTFATAQDWTRNGVKTLTLYFYGQATNAANVPLWFKVTDQNTKTAKVTFGAGTGEDTSALAEPAWTTWNIPLSSFSGVTLSKIKSMTIGLGTGTGTGTLYIDDIRLYPAATGTTVTPTLVGWWKLDNDVKDSSGTGNNGTITGTPTYATGKIGAGLKLNGTTDYVDCGAPASLNITDQVTLSAWVQPTNFANSAYQTFVGKGDHAYNIQHTNGNLIQFFVYDGNWHSANSAAVASTMNSTWHHVAGTYDGTQLKLFVDGVVAGSTIHVGDIDTATHTVSIGRNSEQSGRLFTGTIDEVRIYRGALPTAEVKKLANP